MLANHPDTTAQFGTLSREVQMPGTFRNELLEFIAMQLPIWRDHPDRSKENAETLLTSQLCAHLNTVARKAQGWDVLQFRVEEADELNRARKIDLIASPCGPAIWIEGRRHTQFDSLMPIECKRLPTPTGTRRDEREYVVSKYSSTGGIERFKEGRHGSQHKFGAMIGYVQEESLSFWNARVTGWIKDLVSSAQSGWTENDLLKVERNDKRQKLAVFRSEHKRNGLPTIELCHIWLEMN